MQIQRIQSVYLFLATILMVIFIFLPVIGLINDNGLSAMGAVTVGTIQHAMPLLLCLDALVAILLFITIFKYRNLSQQMKLCKVNILLIISLLAYIFITAYMQKGESIAVIQWSIALPFVAIVLTMLALKGIKHDKKLLSDSERIR